MLTYFVDSDCDFNLQDCKELGCKLISMPYSIDGKTTYPYVDFQEFDSHAFYDGLRGGILPTTSAIPEEEYRNYFEPEFQAGNDIFYFHFSEAMTMTFGNMRKVVDDLLKKYPERKFYEIDSKGITIISYLMGRDFFKLVKAGKTPEELVEWGKKEVDHYAQYFFADDLKFFRRSGRVSGLAATMGGLIGLRPVITMNEEGKMVSVGTEKGRIKAMNRLVSEVVEKGDEVKAHGVVVGHTDSPEVAAQVADMLREKFGADLEIRIIPTNPTAGSHCGPNGVGVTFHSKCR